MDTTKLESIWNFRRTDFRGPDSPCSAVRQPSPSSGSVLKNQRAKAIRFSTLTAICDALECQPGDLFTVE